VLETSAFDGKKEKQIIVDDQFAKSEQRKFEVPKIMKELPLLKSKSQPRCPLGLSSWQEKKLQRLNAQGLKNKKMAWVPKKSIQVQDKDNNVPLYNATGTVERKRRSSHSMRSVLFVHGSEQILLNGQLSFGRKSFPNDVNVGSIVGGDSKNRMTELLTDSGLDCSNAEAVVISAINKNSRSKTSMCS
jgi:hypothetical protein